MATYFIRIDTFWQNSPDRYIGPFETRDEASKEIDRAQNAENSRVTLAGRLSSDVKYGIRCHGILSKTEAERRGMTQKNKLGRTIPLDTYELDESEELYLTY